MMDFLDELYNLLPGVRSQLNSPANAAELKELQSAFGYELPQELVEFLKRHDGERIYSGIFCGLSFLSVSEMRQALTINREVYESENPRANSLPADFIREDYYNPGWFPFAADHGGNYLGIDFNPGTKGTPGQIINFGRDEETMFVLAASFKEWLDFVLAQIKNGNCRWKEKDSEASFYLSWKEDRHFFDDLADLFLADSFSEEVISWGDLDQSWRTLILDLTGKEITSNRELQSIISLNLLGSGITDLTPLQYFPRLLKVIASGLRIKDFTPLGRLRQMKTLYLAKTPLTTLKPLEQLQALKELSIGNTLVTDISTLAKLQNLAALSLENLFIRDLSPLRELKKLKSLNLKKIKTTELSIIGELKNLEELYISSVPLKEVDFVQGLSKLKHLAMEACASGDYSPLKSLSNLKRITGSFEVFEKTKDLFDRPLSYTISGEITPEQERIYLEYMRYGG